MIGNRSGVLKKPWHQVIFISCGLVVDDTLDPLSAMLPGAKWCECVSISGSASRQREVPTGPHYAYKFSKSQAEQLLNRGSDWSWRRFETLPIK